jgi:hypothetical protein
VGDVVSLEQANRAPLHGYDVMYLIFPDHVSLQGMPMAQVLRRWRAG